MLLSPAASGTTFPNTPSPFSVSRQREKTWRAEGGLVRTGLVGKALRQIHPWLSSATCQLPHTFPDNCLDIKAGLGPPWGLEEDHSSSLQVCIAEIQMTESKTKFIQIQGSESQWAYGLVHDNVSLSTYKYAYGRPG